MDVKSVIVDDFDKSNFILEDHSGNNDHDISCIDEGLREFIFRLNQSPHIMTKFSCEGHADGDVGYLLFSVGEMGWDIFWQTIMPKISHLFCGINKYTPNDLKPQMPWHVQVGTNDSGSLIGLYGVFNHLDLDPFHTKIVGTNCVSWQLRRWRFWMIIQSVFLEHFSIQENSFED